jgi:hypothetical protein
VEWGRSCTSIGSTGMSLFCWVLRLDLTGWNKGLLGEKLRWYDFGSFFSLLSIQYPNLADLSKETTASAFYPTICTLFFYQDTTLTLLPRTQTTVSACYTIVVLMGVYMRSSAM